MNRSARTAAVAVAVLVAAGSVAVGAPLLAPAGGTAAAQQGEPSGALVITAVAMPSIATPGWFNATATLENPTGSEVTEEVAFRFEGGPHDVVVQRRVTVPPNATRRVSFSLDTSGFATDDYIAGVTTANSSELEEVELSTTAAVDLDTQETNGTTVEVDSVFLPRGGYVVVHNSSLLDGETVGSVIGTSDYLEAGFHRSVTVRLYDVPGASYDADRLSADATLVAMAHRETTGDRSFDFVSTDGTADGPYLDAGQPVTAAANVSVSGTGSAATSGTGGSTPGTRG